MSGFDEFLNESSDKTKYALVKQPGGKVAVVMKKTILGVRYEAQAICDDRDEAIIYHLENFEKEALARYQKNLWG